MKKWYEEFVDKDYTGEAVEKLNLFVKNNPTYNVKVIAYNVVRYEGLNKERTYILAEVEYES